MHRLGIIIVMLLAALLNFARLGQEGFANLYYAAGVKSMLLNWHNFFFVAFDPGGFITIDKPPLGFWLQALSAKILGFSGWSIILPQALAGVISAFLIYIIVSRYHGLVAGLISALTLTLTPIIVAASRNNTIDGLLVMTSLMATWAFLTAMEKASFKRLLIAFALVGIGFNIKSLQAFMILPAFYVSYLWGQLGSFKKKTMHLAAATLVLICIALPWFLVVDSIPPEARPYVGSSETNSTLELATGYNGLGHFLGYGVRVPGRQPDDNNGLRGITAAETGSPGPFRLLNKQLGGQISWLLPFALIVPILSLKQIKSVDSRKIHLLLFWSGWLIPQLIFFSVAQGIHRYYLVMMAPAIAALTGIGCSLMVSWLSDQGKKSYTLPAALVVTISLQGLLLSRYIGWYDWLMPTVLIAGLGTALCLVWLLCLAKIKTIYGKIFTCFAVGSMMIAPLTWSLTPVLYHETRLGRTLPFAGPELALPAATLRGASGLSVRDATGDILHLSKYLLANHQSQKYLVAVPNAQIAAPLILITGQPVITYGGFLGSEKILSTDKLAEMVASGQVRYIMIGSFYSQQSEVDAWVISHGTLVPDTEWQHPRENTNAVPQRMPKLYDCLPSPK